MNTATTTRAVTGLSNKLRELNLAFAADRLARLDLRAPGAMDVLNELTRELTPVGDTLDEALSGLLFRQAVTYPTGGSGSDFEELAAKVSAYTVRASEFRLVRECLKKFREAAGLFLKPSGTLKDSIDRGEKVLALCAEVCERLDLPTGESAGA